MDPFTRKYEPKQLKDLVGQNGALKGILSFLHTFPQEKAVILYGPTGVGKTSAVKAIASQMNYELIELNASDKRNKNSIEETLLPASQQASLFGSKKIILVDEIDNLSGRDDRGGAQAVADIIEKTKFPIILTTNDLESDKLKAIKKIAKVIEFTSVNPEACAMKLIDICNSEGILYEDKAIAMIISSSRGDLRAAINDLEMFSARKELFLKNIITSGREKEESLKKVLIDILCADPQKSLDRIETMDEEYDLLLLWLDENLQRVYNNDSLSKAYTHLARASTFLSRISRQQHWRFLVYVKFLLTAGVSSAKDVCRSAFEPKQPSLMLKMWQRNMRRAKNKALLEMLSSQLHTSVKQLEKDFLPYLQFIQLKNPKLAEELCTK